MNEPSQVIVGKQMQKYRTAKKLSLKQLEKLTGISSSYIGELEQGGRTKGCSISMKNICKIAEVLGVSLDDLAYSNLEYNMNKTNNKYIDDLLKEIEFLNLNELFLLDNTIDIFIKYKNKKQLQ